MAGDEVGMKMRQEYVLDLDRVLGGEGDVLVDVALRVNDGCRACLLVSYDIGSVRQARQVELLEDHATPFRRPRCICGRLRWSPITQTRLLRLGNDPNIR